MGGAVTTPELVAPDPEHPESQRYTSLQLAAAWRIEAPESAPACRAYLAHFAGCERGCGLDPNGRFSECVTAVELRVPADAEYEALPLGARTEGWWARP